MGRGREVKEFAVALTILDDPPAGRAINAVTIPKSISYKV